jgi:hypothetical protein
MDVKLDTCNISLGYGYASEDGITGLKLDTCNISLGYGYASEDGITGLYGVISLLYVIHTLETCSFYCFMSTWTCLLG